MGNVDFIVPGLSVAAVHSTCNVRRKHSPCGHKGDLGCCQERVKIATVKGTVLKAHFTEQRTILGVIPYAK